MEEMEETISEQQRLPRLNWASQAAQGQRTRHRRHRDAGSILSQKDLLGEETATHSSIFARTAPWTEESGGLQLKGSQESDTTEQLRTLEYK